MEVSLLRSAPSPPPMRQAPQANPLAANGKLPDVPAETPAPEETKPAPAKMPVKPFNTESLSQRLRPTRATDIPDAPTVGGPGVSATAVPGLNLDAVSAPAAPASPPPPPTATPAPTPAASVQKVPVAGGNLKQATLKFRKEPEYPKLAKQAGAKGEVVLTATIATNGRLKNIKMVKGHPMLVKAAMDAVAQWIYEPTVLNNQPVESQTEIKLNFVGER